MNKWKVRFKKLMDKEWHYCEKPFDSQKSAEFFAATIQITSPNFEAVAVEEESCQNSEK